MLVEGSPAENWNPKQYSNAVGPVEVVVEVVVEMVVTIVDIIVSLANQADDLLCETRRACARRR